MPAFDECCVLIPVATLEDFPSNLSDSDARSLLAGWTVLWHPRLLAQTEQTPTWYRADSPPEPFGKRLFTVPTPSRPELPGGYETRAQQFPDCHWICGESRQEMCEAIETLLEADSLPTLQHDGRSVGVEDFFAAGYASLQIQVMTRRLRYTSNLDEIHLQNRIVEAAQSFLAGNTEQAIAALHDVFDCLAEERDHYFSSDPHLIDLNLTSESTLDSLLQMINELPAESPADDIAATPTNVLIDWDVAQAIANLPTDKRAAAEPLKQALASEQVGWAGGGPPADACLDMMSLREAETLFVDSHQTTLQALGSSPSVFARFAGATPADLTPTLVKLGYCGMIPLDFANGTGHGDEAKVVIQSAGVELEALTAKPIDAASDASFLTLGTVLGEAIDSGEIATALLVHWPGQSCDSFEDLLKISSWSLCLGRFWKLGDYFVKGEHPYHHGSISSGAGSSAQRLPDMVQRGHADPLSTPAAKFRDQVQSEHNSLLHGLARLTNFSAGDTSDSVAAFVSAVTGAPPSDGPAKLLINPNSLGTRVQVKLSSPPAEAKHVFANTDTSDGCITTTDIPAFGFVSVQPDGGSAQITFGQRLKEKLLGGPQATAEHGRLHNEFMDVTISEDSGGISGVYSGKLRGNRFSMRLIRNAVDEAGKAIETTMKCDRLRVVEASSALGCIETTGKIVVEDKTLATFRLRYSLRCGSRALEVNGELQPQIDLTDSPWKDNFAARVAVSDEGAIYRCLVRDKVQRSRSRRVVAPLGVLIDETERQTLVGSNGLAYHYRHGDRFLDTIIHVKGETNQQFKLHYCFDVPSSIAFARSLIQPPQQIAIPANPKLPPIGWIVHTAPKDVVITELNVERRDDGKLLALVRLIQTKPQPSKAKVRFLHNVAAAFVSQGSYDLNCKLPAPKTDAEEKDDATTEQTPVDDTAWLNCQDDAVSVSISGHGVVDLVVILDPT